MIYIDTFNTYNNFNSTRFQAKRNSNDIRFIIQACWYVNHLIFRFDLTCSYYYIFTANQYFESTPASEWTYPGYLEKMQPYFNNHFKLSSLKSTWKKRFNEHLREIERDQVGEKCTFASDLLNQVSKT